MSRLLTMALVETTRDPASYAVAAYDIDEETWVYFKGIPMAEFLDSSGNPVWDIFSITEAEYVEQRRGRDPRPGIVNLTNSSQPVITSRITTDRARLQWLDEIASADVRSIYTSTEYFGLIPVREVNGVYFRVHEGKRRQRQFTLESPFYWEARVIFTDPSGAAWSFPCKDLRWKTYFWQQVHERGRSVEELQERWMDALNDNQTYFIIEIYPPMFDRPGDFGDGSGHYGAVSGIISIPI
ncbi:MAG: hypothetical protein ACOYEU_03115 [Limnochordia bacterium]|jgi:hypothetical protein